MILERIGQETGVSTDEILEIAVTASHRYKTYRISKRTGGYRIINHPTPDLKYLQRWLNRNIFSSLPVHDAAFAYRSGMGIADNAKQHLKNNYLLKVDFSDFFPSLKHKDVKTVLELYLENNTTDITEFDIDIILQIVCKNRALTIGSPSSPVLSNAILYDFDCFVSGICQKMGIAYSRYADDLFLSTNRPNTLEKVLEVIREDLRDRTSPHLEINNKKTVFTSKKRRRIVAGIVLSSEGKLSIGREKKRKIRTLIHLYSTNALPAEKVSYLRGYIAFASSIEPEFVDRVREKYGGETITKLMGTEPVMRKTYGK